MSSPGPSGTATPRPCLSVVMPAFNEEATVATSAARVLASPWCGQLVIVDDGSTDATRQQAEQVAATDPRVTLLHQRSNRGKGAALRWGFSTATEEVVIVQDADLEYDPDEFGLVVAPIVNGAADAVFGSRFTSGGPHRVLYYWHYLGNRFLTTLSNAFTNLNLTDMETCYKAFRREVIQAITIEEDRFGFEPEITAKLARRDLRIYEVGISYAGRTYADGKKIGWRDGVRAMVCIVKYSPVGERLRRH